MAYSFPYLVKRGIRLNLVQCIILYYYYGWIYYLEYQYLFALYLFHEEEAYYTLVAMASM